MFRTESAGNNGARSETHYETLKHTRCCGTTSRSTVAVQNAFKQAVSERQIWAFINAEIEYGKLLTALDFTYLVMFLSEHEKCRESDAEGQELADDCA